MQTADTFLHSVRQKDFHSLPVAQQGASKQPQLRFSVNRFDPTHQEASRCQRLSAAQSSAIIRLYYDSFPLEALGTSLPYFITNRQCLNAHSSPQVTTDLRRVVNNSSGPRLTAPGTAIHGRSFIGANKSWVRLDSYFKNTSTYQVTLSEEKWTRVPSLTMARVS